MSVFEMFMVGDCQSLLLKLTNERCEELRETLQRAIVWKISAEQSPRQERDVSNDSGNKFGNAVLSLCRAQGEGGCINYQGYAQIYAYDEDINKWNTRGSAIDGISNSAGASKGFTSTHKLCGINEQQIVTNFMKDLSSIIVKPKEVDVSGVRASSLSLSYEVVVELSLTNDNK